MTTEEKVANDQLLERYQLSATERHLYESTSRQCLGCEAQRACSRRPRSETWPGRQAI